MGMVVEHLTFGLGTLKLSQTDSSGVGYAGQKATNVGTEEAPISKGIYGTLAEVTEPLWLGKANTVKLDYPTAAGAEQTIQLGGLKGNFTDRYHLRIYVLEKIDSDDDVTFTLLSKQGDKPTDADDVLNYKLKAEEFNAHFMSGKPIEISLPSTVKNANIIKVDCGSKPSTGIIKACIEPKAW